MKWYEYSGHAISKEYHLAYCQSRPDCTLLYLCDIRIFFVDFPYHQATRRFLVPCRAQSEYLQASVLSKHEASIGKPVLSANFYGRFYAEHRQTFNLI